jgi:PBP4 family serine-type D-alanyl-D-alanine carboxypeptidase
LNYNFIIFLVFIPILIFSNTTLPSTKKKSDENILKKIEKASKDEENILKKIEKASKEKEKIQEKLNEKAINESNQESPPVKQYKSLAELIIDIFSDLDFKDTKISFTLINDKAKSIISINKDLVLNQASVSKIIVSLAAIKYLGLNYRFKTNFYIDNDIDKDGVLDGNLIIKGFGDPNLLTEDIYKIIDFLKLIGLKEIKGNIIVDLSYFDKKYSIYQLKDEDSSRAYSAFNNALPLNYNSIKFSMKPYIDEEDETKNKVNVNVSYPGSLVVKLKNKLTVSKRYSRIKAETFEEKYGYTGLKLTGRINKKINLFVFYRKIQNPDYYFGKIFIRMLKYSRVKVKGRLLLRYTNQVKNKSNVKLLYSHTTKHLFDTIVLMNRYSNNFIAEQLLKIIGAKTSKTEDSLGVGSWENGIIAVKKMLKEDIGIDESKYTYTNASGLNDADFFSSSQIAKILHYIKNNFDYKWYMLSTLPKIGITGTLKRYCLNEDCKGSIIAKTGSLRTTVALAGFINVANKLHSFSLAINFDSSKEKFRKLLLKTKELMSNITSLENL